MTRLAGLLFGLVLLVGTIAGGGGARSEEMPAGEAATIRSLIQSQLDAFQRDDGAAAYALAAPGIHGIFTSVDQFMDMVRRGYPPVYRPKSVTFGPLVNSPMGPLQKVYLVGPDGGAYVAIYTLERQPDGTWKINGCAVLPDDGKAI